MSNPRLGRLPDFIIVGAMKSGTTSLAAWLRAHPQVFMPAQKELHFFDTFWDRGVDWYRDQFAGAPDGAMVGEATPAYMVLAGYVERMASVVPDARLVLVLRNPVDRAWSHYEHTVAREQEQRPFEEVVEHELASDQSDWRTKGLVLARGRYIDQLQQMTSFYDRAQIHVGLFDDLVREPAALFASVCGFLGVDASIRPEIVGEVFDPKKIDPVIARRATRREVATGGRSRLERVIGKRRAMQMRSRPPPAEGMSPATRRMLVDYYKPYNESLARWLGADLTAWNG